MPVSGDEDAKPYLDTTTRDIRLVSNYTGLDFNSAIELDCYTFKVLVKDAFIERMSKTKEGQEYLENAWILTQSQPDKKSLRKHFGKGG